MVEKALSEDSGRSRLGRGLAALIGDVGDEVAAVERARGQRLVPIEFLRPNPRNPRRHFDEADLEDLAQSIRERGVLQPILVRTIPGMADVYEIIAGERRWRAGQRAGLHEAPILLIEANDRDALEIAIIENVQRADLNALEEAAGYEQLMGDYGHSQSDLARIIGKSRSHVANTLRLLKLPDSVKRSLAEGALSAGHARALLAAADPETLARRVIDDGLTVRDVERLSQEEPLKAATRKPRREKDPDTKALEQALEDVLGLSVSIDHSGDAGGKMTIRYRTLEQLDGLCRRLKD